MQPLRDMSVMQAAALVRSPERFFAERRAAYGDPFQVRLPGAEPLWVTGSPEGARAIFAAPPDTFEPLSDNPVEPLLGPSSLILLGGERHQRERKLMSPPFRGNRMHGYFEAIQRITLEALAQVSEGERIIVQELARRITLRVIVQVVFGVHNVQRRQEFERAIVAMLDRYIAPLMIAKGLRWKLGGFSPWDRFVAARSSFRALLHEELATRRAGTEETNDVLGLLLTLRYEDGGRPSDEALVDQLCTLLVAGHDTTAIGLSWALYYLHRELDVQQRLRVELTSLGHAPALEQLAAAPYLGAVCEEALRLHPVVPIAVRRLVKPLVVNEKQLQPGDAVAVGLTLLHTDPVLYPEPALFKPERFLAWQPSPFEYAPFGGGARRCLGASFAMSEMRVVLGTLLNAATFTLLDDTRPPRPVLHGITMGPREPIALRMDRASTCTSTRAQEVRV
jgi:cytochrome P450